MLNNIVRKKDGNIPSFFVSYLIDKSIHKL